MESPAVSTETKEAFLEDRGLRRAAWVQHLYRLFGDKISPRVWASLARKYEGGEMFSQTLRRILLEHNGVELGAYSYGSVAHVTTARRDGLKVGRYVSTAFTVRWGLPHPLDRISTSSALYSHFSGDHRRPMSEQRLDIGHDAWIGDNVVITANCKQIGIGAAIGAGSIVTHDVPNFAIVVGVPAKVIRYRFDESLRQKVEASRWWELDLASLQQWRQSFNVNASSDEALRALDAIASMGRT